VDAHGAVIGAGAVWAAGDGTTFPIKQGGLAAQQADAAAAAIAGFLGADVCPTPFRPVLRGVLIDPGGRRFLDVRRGDLPAAPLWWPPAKVVTRYLGRYLAPGARERPEAAVDIDVGDLLLDLAAHHESAGERDLALRCLQAARDIRTGRPPDAQARRGPPAGSR
jgi:sulfide:quinone oxidoreductase